MQRSLINLKVLHKDEVSNSYFEPQPEYGGAISVVKPKQKHVTPLSIYALMVGITRQDLDRLKRINDSAAFVDRVSCGDEFEARRSRSTGV